MYYILSKCIIRWLNVCSQPSKCVFVLPKCIRTWLIVAFSFFFFFSSLLSLQVLEGPWALSWVIQESMSLLSFSRHVASCPSRRFMAQIQVCSTPEKWVILQAPRKSEIKGGARGWFWSWVSRGALSRRCLSKCITYCPDVLYFP